MSVSNTFVSIIGETVLSHPPGDRASTIAALVWDGEKAVRGARSSINAFFEKVLSPAPHVMFERVFDRVVSAWLDEMGGDGAVDDSVVSVCLDDLIGRGLLAHRWRDAVRVERDDVRGRMWMRPPARMRSILAEMDGTESRVISLPPRAGMSWFPNGLLSVSGYASSEKTVLTTADRRKRRREFKRAQARRRRRIRRKKARGWV